MTNLNAEDCATAKPSKIFVSHSSVDVAVVRWLKEQVEAMGNLVWVAEWDLQPGGSVTRQILDAIDDCDAYIILLTTAGYDSRYVAHETGAAAASGKPVIALVDMTLDGKPMGLLSDIHQVRFDRNDLATCTAAITAGLFQVASRSRVTLGEMAIVVPSQPTIFSMSLDMNMKFQVTPNQVLVGVCALIVIGGLFYLASLENEYRSAEA